MRIAEHARSPVAANYFQHDDRVTRRRDGRNGEIQNV
jgi:hypothetical protein